MAFQLPIFDRWFSHMDEGHVLLFSDLIAQGGDLYRDATLYPLPGAFYLLAQFYKLFGPSILLSRWIVLLEFAAFVVLVFLLMRRILSLRSAGVVVLLLLGYRIWAFPHWQVYSYTTTCLLAILAAVNCLLRFFDQRRTGWLVAAGLLFGLAVYCKQDYGAAALVVMTATIVVEARRRGASFWRPISIFIAAGAWNRASVQIRSDEAPAYAISPSEQSDFVRREAWPFRRTLALRPASGGRRTVLRLPLRPEAGQVLQTAVGVHPEKWFQMPSFATHFGIAIVSPEARESVYARSLNPHEDFGDRRWFDVEIPLDRWAGREIQLELSVAVDSEQGESLLVGGFAVPRLLD